MAGRYVSAHNKLRRDQSEPAMMATLPTNFTQREISHSIRFQQQQDADEPNQKKGRLAQDGVFPTRRRLKLAKATRVNRP